MKNRSTAYLMMILATLMFAGAFIAGKISAADFSPVMMTFLRIGFATLIMFPIMRIKLGNKWLPTLRELKIAFLLGLIGMTGYHLFFFTALQSTTVTNASVINATMPIVTAMLAFFILRERINLLQIIFMFTAFVGVILTITHWDLRLLNGGLNKGDLFMFCGTLSWSIYGVLIKRLVKKTPSIKLAFYTFFACVVLLMPFALREIIQSNPFVYDFKTYYGIIYMAIFPTVIGYTIQQHVIRSIGPSTAALFINLVPIFSIILSVLILKEDIELKMILSSMMIIASVYAFTKVKTFAIKNN